MSLVNKLFGLEERASFSEANPRDPIVAEWFGGTTNTAAGISVTPDKAMRLSAVFACVRILSSAMASLPLNIYQKTAEGRESAINSPYQALLHDRPNRWQTSFEYREMRAGHVLLRGNAYSQIVYRGDGSVAELIPLHPDKVRPFWTPGGGIAYEYQPEDGPKTILLQNEISHLRGFSSDGLKGLSPIEYMRETVGLTMAAEEFGARYFGNGTVAGGVLEHPQALGDVAYDRLKRDLSAQQGGIGNAHKPMILEEGMKWQALSVPPDQAQFLETRKFQVSEIARIFGVPPHMIGDVEKSTSWGTGIEQQGIGFVVYSLRPWLVRDEQTIKRDLLNTRTTRQLYAEYNVEGLMRGDSAGRAAFYKEMWGIGAYSINDIRAKENDNPIDGGDAHYVPMNYMDIDAAPQDPNAQRALERVYKGQFRQALDRVVTCEVKALERALGADMADFEAKAVEFYKKHADFMRKHLSQLLTDPEPFIRTHLNDSQRQLIDALKSGHVGELLADWRENRTNQIAERELATALEGIKRGY
jgi:HK97 family phage portal protein